MKKYNIGFLMLIMILLQLTSCKKEFLELKNPDELSSDSYWRDSLDANSAIISIYAALNMNYRYGVFEFRYVPENWRSDDVLHNDPTYPSWASLAYFTNDGNVYEIEEFYRYHYMMISRANQCIKNIPLIENISGNLKNQYIAEARFLRAWAYFSLQKNFKNVVLSLSPPVDSKDLANIYPTQPGRDVVWQAIEEDLAFAKQYLPATDVDGRATSGAAAGYLGYVYLFQQKYSLAESEFQDIIDGEYADYDLTLNYFDNFTGQNEFNEESLFEVSYEYSEERNVTTHPFLAEFAGWHTAVASDWVVEEMTSELNNDGGYDPRYKWFVGMSGPDSLFYGSAMSEALQYLNPLGNYSSDFEGGGYNIIMKYNEYNDWENWARCSNNLVMLRFADILLLQAEVINEQNRTSEAYEHIDKVRDRSNMPPLTTGMNKTQMRDAIIHERAVELCFEGKRYYDLVRWHEAGFLNVKDVLTDHGKPFASNWAEKNLYYPIPSYEFATNPNLDPAKQW